MKLDVTGNNLQNKEHHFRLNSVPDICPICHRSIHPKHIISQFLEERDCCQTVFRCTNQKCQELFIATYIIENAKDGSRYLCSFIKVAPLAPDESKFSDTIKEISPSFIEIYNQALSAESHNLGQMVGIGLHWNENKDEIKKKLKELETIQDQNKTKN